MGNAITGRRKIYVASSWRNPYQIGVVSALRYMGHEVYDFRNPAPDCSGFGWSEIDPLWRGWSSDRFLEAIDHPIAKEGFRRDFEAMQWADTFVLVQPCGRSAHLELGWATGRGKVTAILLNGESNGSTLEPELMFKLADHIIPSCNKLLDLFEVFEAGRERNQEIAHEPT